MGLYPTGSKECAQDIRISMTTTKINKITEKFGNNLIKILEYNAKTTRMQKFNSLLASLAVFISIVSLVKAFYP
jgi:hypothetical protein